jgi:hypothetical protein
LKNKIFRVEYYDPIVLGQIEKTIAYDFISLYPVSSLKTIIQVPSTATNFSVTPPGTKTFEGSFTVYTYNNSSIQANKTLHFDIGYSKSNPNPSLGNTTAPAQGSGNWNPLPIMIFGGIIIIAGTLFWAIKTTRKDRRKPNTVLMHKQKVSGKGKQLPSKFCNQCGKRLELPSKFCPYCRHKLDE